jgi:hypothetical protein
MINRLSVSSGKLFIKIMNKTENEVNKTNSEIEEEIALADFFLILLSMLFN